MEKITIHVYDKKRVLVHSTKGTKADALNLAEVYQTDRFIPFGNLIEIHLRVEK